MSYGGYGSAAAQKSALGAAIVATRSNPLNLGFFQSHASNYLNALIQNGTLTNTQIQSIAPTLGISPTGGPINYIVNALQGTMSPPTMPGTDNSSNNSAKGISQSFAGGLSQVQTFLTSHPLALLGIVGVGLLVLLKK